MESAIVWISSPGKSHVYPHMKEAEGGFTHWEKAMWKQNKDRFEDAGFKDWLQLQAKECQELPETGKGKEKILP